MWFQVELPQPAAITEIQFNSTAGGGRGGGGGGGRGAAPAAGAPGAPGAGGAAVAGPVGAAPGAQAGAAPGRGAGVGGGAPGAPTNLGYPRGYKVETSLNGTAWTVAAEGKGEGAETIITFRPVQAKFVKITQTASVDGAPVWSMQQLKLYEAATPGAVRPAAR